MTSSPVSPNRYRGMRIAAILAVLAAIGAGGWMWADRGMPANATTDADADVRLVTTGSIEHRVTALGLLEPRTFVDVGTQVSGQLDRVYVAIGDMVAEGALLAEIDPAIYETRVRGDEAKLRNLEAQLAQARAERDLARLRDDRARRLFRSNALSRDEADTSAADLRIATAKVDALLAQVSEARSTLDGDQANLGYTRILAPISGTVVSQTSVVGQTLNANQTSPIILRIADLATMTVRAQVTEADVVRIRTGQPVRFSTLGMPDRVWESRVRQVLPTPQTLNDVVLYDVLIDIANPDGALMTAMTAQVFFILDQAIDVPLVPLAALHDGADGRVVALRLPDGRTETRPVRIGLVDRGHAQVLAGLQPGDAVGIGPEPATGGAPGTVGSWRSGGRPPAAAMARAAAPAP
ncbi:efflux RND transporter periplasmic adaptor subunit [Tistrella bauzanensis]|uniref:efflux RND transporter periplasmic adaptor subunit n=1 Tax=Tistrella TaxID=171436 RepID=UPI0031F6EB48